MAVADRPHARSASIRLRSEALVPLELVDQVVLPVHCGVPQLAEVNPVGGVPVISPAVACKSTNRADVAPDLEIEAAG